MRKLITTATLSLLTLFGVMNNHTPNQVPGIPAPASVKNTNKGAELLQKVSDTDTLTFGDAQTFTQDFYSKKTHNLVPVRRATVVNNFKKYNYVALSFDMAFDELEENCYPSDYATYRNKMIETIQAFGQTNFNDLITTKSHEVSVYKEGSTGETTKVTLEEAKMVIPVAKLKALLDHTKLSFGSYSVVINFTALPILTHNDVDITDPYVTLWKTEPQLLGSVGYYWSAVPNENGYHLGYYPNEDILTKVNNLRDHVIGISFETGKFWDTNSITCNWLSEVFTEYGHLPDTNGYSDYYSCKDITAMYDSHTMALGLFESWMNDYTFEDEREFLLDDCPLENCQYHDGKEHEFKCLSVGYKLYDLGEDPVQGSLPEVQVEADWDDHKTCEQYFADAKSAGKFAKFKDPKVLGDWPVINKQLWYYRIRFSYLDGDERKFGEFVVHINDKRGPEITMTGNLNLKVNGRISIDDIAERLSIVDNRDGEQTLEDIKEGIADCITIDKKPWKDLVDEEGYVTFDKTMVGQHILTISVGDNSGNATVKDFLIYVNDSDGPVIRRKDNQATTIYIGLDRALRMKNTDLLTYFVAEDEVDGDVSTSLAIDGNFSMTKTGVHEITLVATDKAKNQGKNTFKVAVTDDLPDCILLSEDDIEVFTGNPLKSDDIRKLIANGFYSGQDVELKNILVNDNEYQKNNQKAGSYFVKYSLTIKKAGNEVETKDGVVKLTVVDNGAPVKTTNFFLLFFQRVGNWFKGIFTHFDFSCFITDEEFEKKYPTVEETKESTETSTAADTTTSSPSLSTN